MESQTLNKKHLLIVREFDRIVYNPDYEEKEGYHCVSKNEFDELTSFIIRVIYDAIKLTNYQ